jgi:putative ATP-dependent endonuclease of OLD family
MKLGEVRVQGFRCLEDVTLAFDELTILLGSNSTGKSSLLKALKFFFDDDALAAEDVFGRDGDGFVLVQATFLDLAPADREAFGPYAHGQQMVLTRSWRDGESNFSGRALQFAGFDDVRSMTGAARTKAYRELVKAEPDLGLVDTTTIDAADREMLAWEMAHPDRCRIENDPSRFHGFPSVGKSLLGTRFKFVFVPGLRDAAAEAVEGRATLLGQILSAVAEQRAEANTALTELETETRKKYAKVIEASHGPTLRDLARRLETHLQRYVPSGSLELRPIESQLTIAPPAVELRGGEGSDQSDLSRQGHGFQRTFIMAALEYLASTSAPNDAAHRPSLFFAIEEPELYQHPPRARHFFRTLRSLAGDDPNVQVAYATHSPYFVSPEDFTRIRIFRRRPREDQKPPATAVTRAMLEAVQLAVDERRRKQLPRYMARTMREAFCEAFFGQSALVVEGITDVGVMTQVGQLMGFDLASHGVVVVPVSKGDQPVALAVLRALEIPTYVVFDAGSEAVDTEPCRHCGRQGQKRRAEEQKENEAILRALGASPEPFPGSGARDEWACFESDLEQFLADAIPAFDQQARTIADEMGWKMKSPEVYAEVLERLGREGLPELLTQIVSRALRSAGIAAQ